MSGSNLKQVGDKFNCGGAEQREFLASPKSSKSTAAIDFGRAWVYMWRRNIWSRYA